MALPSGYEGYYNDLSQRLLNDVGKVDYTPMSTGTLKSALQRVIRPSYDKSIQSRQQATRANRAAIDADAASRGIGASTWVTDAKNRLATNEARDIANINDDYNSALYSALMGRLAEQDQLGMAAQQANLSARQGALGNALSGAQYLYGLDQANAARGGGGGGGGGGSRSRNGKTDDSYGSDLSPTAAAAGKKATEIVNNAKYDTRPLSEAAQAKPSAEYSAALSKSFQTAQAAKKIASQSNSAVKKNTKLNQVK